MKSSWSLQESGQYRAASDPSRAESISDPQKSGRAADEQGRGRLDDRNQITQLCFPAAPLARRGPANLPDKLIAARVHPQSWSRRFNYEYKAAL